MSVTRIILLFLLLTTGPTAWGQHTIRVVMRDSTTREALSGVSAAVLGTTVGAATDNKGQLILENVPGRRRCC
ncbi:hypothetical protein [Hymenobacter sp.]|jgi:hypothetical protein|uniref:hypothetical protein n=1 Tax=Hymenobacter sp. TaxID=1898978 RepID=UPI002EDB6E0F